MKKKASRSTPQWTRVILVCAAAMFLTGNLQGQSVDWIGYNGNLSADRYSPLTAITRQNVDSLREVCTFDTNEHIGFQAVPVVIAGTMYVTTDTATYAFDATNCQLRWHNSHVYAPLSYLGNNHGVAFMNGRLFRTSNDVHAYSIEASTGKTVWDVSFGDPTKGESAPMAPLAWNGLVFVGNAGGDVFGVTGRVYALDAGDGHVVWQFNVVPDSGAARRTWTKESAKNPPTGGGLWTSFSMDAGDGILYIAAGNPAPDFVIALHPGLNLYTNAIIALDAKTGRVLSYVQPTKGDFHDWDISAAPTVITTRNGKQVLAAAGKSGLLYGIDRTSARPTGDAGGGIFPILYSTPTTTRSNVTTPLSSSKYTRFCPGTQGGTEWNGPAYNADLNLLYVTAVDWCSSVKLQRLDTLKGKQGGAWTGSDDSKGPFGRFDPKTSWKGWLSAVDADSGKVRWKYRSPTPLLGGVTATASELVFSGDLNGDVFALDGRTGKVLWRSPTNNAIGGGVITYAVGGKQYVAAAAGLKSPIWPVKAESARVVIYGLP
jgi:alcohol dehydrogenase (cytochrome c)